MNRRSLFRLIAAAVCGRKILKPATPFPSHTFYFADSAGLWHQYRERPLLKLNGYPEFVKEIIRMQVELIEMAPSPPWIGGVMR